ncbi:MAG: TlpA disulfide reductase family protein [Myxococcota bacterium]
MNTADEVVPRRARLVFLWTAGLALVVFLLVQAWLAARADRPEMRVKRLMPSIGAEVVDQPLTAEQLSWPVETGDDSHITLAQMPKDTLVFLNFWATWCPPCRDELPSMFRLKRQLQDRRFIMVAVSYDDAWANIRDFFTKWVGDLPSQSQMLLVRDPMQSGGKTLRETFGTTKLPDTYVLMNGRIVARFVNARNWVDPSIIDYFQQLAPRR